MNESIIVENEHGVTIELRRWGQDKSRWLDYNAQEWQAVGDGRWEKQDWLKAGGFKPDCAREIGRWSGSVDLYKAAQRARSNKSGFRNWAPREAA